MALSDDYRAHVRDLFSGLGPVEVRRSLVPAERAAAAKRAAKARKQARAVRRHA